jgi:hypothetical protein
VVELGAAEVGEVTRVGSGGRVVHVDGDACVRQSVGATDGDNNGATVVENVPW